MLQCHFSEWAVFAAIPVAVDIPSGQQLPASLAQCCAGRIAKYLLRFRVPKNDNAMPIHGKGGISGYIICCLSSHAVPTTKRPFYRNKIKKSNPGHNAKVPMPGMTARSITWAKSLGAESILPLGPIHSAVTKYCIPNPL